MPTPPSTPPSCLVFVYLNSLLGMDPQAGQAALSIRNAQEFSPPGSGVMVPPTTQVIPCDSYGYCAGEVIASQTAGVAYLFEIQFTDQFNQLQVTQLGWAQIPNQTTLDLSTVTFTPNSDGSQ